MRDCQWPGGEVKLDTGAGGERREEIKDSEEGVVGGMGQEMETGRWSAKKDDRARSIQPLRSANWSPEDVAGVERASLPPGFICSVVGT